MDDKELAALEKNLFDEDWVHDMETGEWIQKIESLITALRAERKALERAAEKLAEVHDHLYYEACVLAEEEQGDKDYWLRYFREVEDAK